MIPARLGSSRFPRKVLARATGKYLIQHVHERVLGCPGVDRVLIATDSGEVLEACRSFGAEAVLTSPSHASGTDRVAEVARGLTHEIVVNVQGDEPLIEHRDIETLVRLFDAGPVSPAGGCEISGTSMPSEAASLEAVSLEAASLEAVPLEAARLVMTTLVAPRRDAEGFANPNIVKAVLDREGYALYFSRAPVPHAGPGAHGASGAGGGPGPNGGLSDVAELDGGALWYQHIGIYGYRREFLLELSKLRPSPLERRERLEQLRVLEHGFRIRVGLTYGRHLGIDTEEEYRRFVKEFGAADRSGAQDGGEVKRV